MAFVEGSHSHSCIEVLRKNQQYVDEGGLVSQEYLDSQKLCEKSFTMVCEEAKLLEEKRKNILSRINYWLKDE